MTSKRLVRLSAVVTLTLVTSACSVYHVPGQPPAPVEEPGGYPVDTPQTQPYPPVREAEREEAEPGAALAYRPLLKRAEEATARGDYEHALSQLERARRIDPDNAEIYLALAKTHDARGDFKQAQANAERGLLYCRGASQCEALRVYTR